MPRTSSTDTKKTGAAAAKATAPSKSADGVGTPNVDVAPVVDVKVVNVKPVLTPDMQVPCVSLVRRGELLYVSKRTHGYKVSWQNYLDVQMVDLSELVAMRSSDHAFFKENYIAIPESFELRDEVLKHLHIEHYYDHTPDPYAMNNLFNMSINDMVERIENMATSARDAVKAEAKKAIVDGSLDSLKRIVALEGVLHCKLT